MASTVSSTTGTSQPVVSVASSSSSGAAGGSVIDVNSLVAQLVAATEAPQEALLNSQTQQVTSQISALGTLKSALSTFQSALAALDTTSAFQLETATSSNQSAVTATASSGAPAGTYNVVVSQLAQSEQLLSNSITGSLGTGTLSISLGGASFQVSVDSSDNTLSGIAQAIDSAAGNPGVTATVLQGANGQQLLLSSSQTGAASTIGVSETDGGNGLAALTYSPTNTANYTQESAAQDAKFTVSGVSFTSPTNTVTGAMSGVTFNLLATTPVGTPAAVTIGNDNSTISTNIAAFVSAYNTLQQALVSLGGYDSSTATAGPMMGDGAFTQIQNQIQQALYSVVDTGSSTYNTLASIGITTNSDGSLSLNSGTLASALNTNFSAVSQIFAGATGVATNLNTDITAALGANGSITNEGQTLTSQENALTTQSDNLNTQMAQLTASLTQQYAALNTLLSSLQSTSSYLTQAFATLPQVQSTQSA
jgi:flagellar hook-associated protein 2